MKKYQISAIGNAIVDVVSFVSEEFLEKNNLTKGSMSLIDDSKAIYFSQNLSKIEKICAGGSAANTIYTLGQKGLDAAFIGKIANDEYGKIFSKSLLSQNVQFHQLNSSQKQTARSFVLVTPDGQRTMATFLSDAGNIEKQIDYQIIQESDIFYIEGYLWDLPSSIANLKKAIKFAKENGIKVAFTLSDLFCVSRHKEDFLQMLPLVDIVFSNKSEAEALFDDHNFMHHANKNQITLAVTKDKDGVDIFDGCLNISHSVKVDFVKNIVDTTGAGDAFAAGFLYGLCKNKNLEESAKIGNELASKIIQVIGAKLDSNTKVYL
jgi:sugar/nucleoside kinase (ribokinase family)